jgi:hypothetical protein
LTRTPSHLIVCSVRSDATRSTLAPALEAMPDAAWREFLRAADRHGVTPLIADRWQAIGLVDQAPAAVRDRLLAAYRANDARNACVRREVVEYWQLLTQAAVPGIVLKGWPLARMLYESPALRLITDLDVLIPHDKAAAGLRALEAAGLERLPVNREAWVQKHLPAYWRVNGRRVTYPLADVFDPHHPRAVELHVRVWEQNFRGLRLRNPEGLWERSRWVSVAGCSMRVPSLEDTFIHLCVHWACHWIEREARLNQLVDLDRFVRKYADRLDWPVALRVSEAAGVSRLVCAALHVARLVLDTPPVPDEVTDRFRAACPRGLRRWIDRYAAEDVLQLAGDPPDKGTAYVLTWLSAQSMSERVGVLRYALLPPREFIMRRYRLKRRWQALPFYLPYALGRTARVVWPFAKALTRLAGLRRSRA